MGAPALIVIFTCQVYEEVMDCKTAMEKVNGFHLQDRYIVCESSLLRLPGLQATMPSSGS